MSSISKPSFQQYDHFLPHSLASEEVQHLLLTMELDLDVEGIERMLLDLTIISGILLQADIIIMIYFINQLLSVIELTHQRTLT